MAQKHSKSNLFSIDFAAIEKLLEDANQPLLSNAEELITKAQAYPDRISSNAEAEELKFFLKKLRSQNKDVASARLSDGRPFSDASKVVKKWFGKTEDRLKAADKRISRVLSSYVSALQAQVTQAEQRNEQMQRHKQDVTIPIAQTRDGKQIIEATPSISNNTDEKLDQPEVPNIALVWQVKSYDINELDLEKLKNYFTDHAIKTAINSYIRQNGPNQLSGVDCEQTVAKRF